MPADGMPAAHLRKMRSLKVRVTLDGEGDVTVEIDGPEACARFYCLKAAWNPEHERRDEKTAAGWRATGFGTGKDGRRHALELLRLAGCRVSRQACHGKVNGDGVDRRARPLVPAHLESDWPWDDGQGQGSGRSG